MRRTLAATAGLLACALGGGARAAAGTAELRCELRYASEILEVRAAPVADPYRVRSHDLAGRFRFKAVVAGEAARVDYVKLYVYDMAVAGAPILLHQATHRPPFPAAAQPPALTGWNHLYSARLGREMIYGCALTGVAP